MRTDESFSGAPRQSNDLANILTGADLPPGWRLTYFPQIGSTNDEAMAAARSGAPDRSIYLTDFQTAGRGRRGRNWTAPPGSSLLFSILFRGRQLSPLQYTMVCSVALCEAVEQMLSLKPAVKWPNDVLVDQRKVCGVLSEVGSTPHDSFTVVGMGINVNLASEDLAALSPAAGSLSVAAGGRVHRGELLARILGGIDHWLQLAPEALDDRLWQAWEGRLWGKEQAVSVVSAPGQTLRGVIERVERDGSLHLRLTDGSIMRIVAGDLIL